MHLTPSQVGYKVEDPDPSKCVRHYLIRPEDLAGTKKALPDFLAEQAAFVNVLQVSVEALQGPVVHRKFAKDPVFEQYYSKRNTISNVNGYDVRISPKPIPSVVCVVWLCTHCSCLMPPPT